jgi:hypothetical protein
MPPLLPPRWWRSKTLWHNNTMRLSTARRKGQAMAFALIARRAQEALKNHIRMGRSRDSRSVPILPTRRNALPHALFLQGWDLLRSSPTEARELDVPALLQQRRGASLATGFSRTSIPFSPGHGSPSPESN